MLPTALQAAPLQDLPLCFPGRDCVDVPPSGAQAMYLVSDLSPASPAIAALLWCGIGVALMLIVTDLREQWRSGRVRPRLPLLAVGLLMTGAVLAWTTRAWLGQATIVYSGEDGRPAAPVPSVVVSAWPLVQSAAIAGIALGAIALFLVLNRTVAQRRRGGLQRAT